MPSGYYFKVTILLYSGNVMNLSILGKRVCEAAEPPRDF